MSRSPARSPSGDSFSWRRREHAPCHGPISRPCAESANPRLCQCVPRRVNSRSPAPRVAAAMAGAGGRHLEGPSCGLISGTSERHETRHGLSHATPINRRLPRSSTRRGRLCDRSRSGAAARASTPSRPIAAPLVRARVAAATRHARAVVLAATEPRGAAARVSLHVTAAGSSHIRAP